MKREPNTEYILSLSYGKDSMACLGAIEQQGWPLDRIVTVEVWATDTIPADLPPMVEFKERADAIIKERWGIEVEHVTAMKSQRERERERETYESMFYRVQTRGKYIGNIKGFPPTRGAWCKHLKYGSKVDLSGYLLSSNPNKRRQEDIRISDEADAVVYGVTQTRSDREDAPQYAGGGSTQRIQYLGIAVDEPERLARLDKVNKLSPLEAIGWTEADCRKWCEENNLLSPIYTTATRGGCWFCHNQGVDQLRQLRKNYPDLWKILLKWDEDSPVTFHSNGKTVRDYDKRFMLEDLRQIPVDRTFRWKMLDPPDETTPS